MADDLEYAMPPSAREVASSNLLNDGKGIDAKVYGGVAGIGMDSNGNPVQYDSTVPTFGAEASYTNDNGFALTGGVAKEEQAALAAFLNAKYAGTYGGVEGTASTDGFSNKYEYGGHVNVTPDVIASIQQQKYSSPGFSETSKPKYGVGYKGDGYSVGANMQNKGNGNVYGVTADMAF